MDYKEKYEEALERARLINNGEGVEAENGTSICEAIFPELKESEDEKIRKVLIELVKCNEKSGYFLLNNVTTSSMLAWLEKQKTVQKFDRPQTEIKDDVYIKSKIEHIPTYLKPIVEFILPYANWNLHKAEYNQPTAQVPLFRVLDALVQEGKPYQSSCEKQGEKEPVGFYYVNSDGKKFYSDTFKYGDVTLHVEKQGEQKPANKIEPKFKVGDWIIYNRDNYSKEIIQVYDIRDGRYYFTDNVHFSWSIKECDEKCRLWTIQDAKDGDVLVDVYGNTGIFQENDDFDWTSYCSLGHNGGFQNFKVEHENDKTHPATKEQRDLLFQKMYEAGYEWDAEKKKLRKIEQKPIVWTKEDEENLLEVILSVRKFYTSNNDAQGLVDWLKTLKERIGG